MSRKLNFVIAAVAIVALVVGMKMWHKSSLTNTQPGGLNAVIMSPPKDVDKFALLNTQGQPFNRNSLWAHWTFMLFGSATNSPESLSQTMTSLNKVVHILQSQKQTPVPQVVFVSINPAQDTLDSLIKFTTKFNPDFIGVTGDMEQVKLLTHFLSPQQKEAILLFDPAGKLAGIFPTPHRPESMVNDFKIIVQNEG